MDNIELLGHSGVKIIGEKIIYIDPYKLVNTINDADYIFITHNHYDHYSPEDILKLKKDDTFIVAPEDLRNDILNLGFEVKNVVLVKPNNSYNLEKINFLTVVSYNNSKAFHPRKNEWVGYIINYNDKSYYVVGDSDFVEELKNVKCTVAFVPVGGTYTMDYKEAADLVNTIKPQLAIPIHYGSIVGTKEDAKRFCELVDNNIKCKIMM